MKFLVWYFAYGSNMDSKRLEARIGRSSMQWAVGMIRGYELVFNKVANDESGYANIRPSERGIVYGVLYLLSKQELRKLNRYEGVPEHYKCVRLQVETEHDVIKAMSYIAADSKVKEGLRPRCDYLECLIKGAKEHNLPQDYIRQLSEIECLKGDTPGAG
ncbi:MAG TPA: gamma-glutamylcyclotransferase family protein [Blastocatellia bacterium]|nr:gamma-glutamylcyclotransferase family protein [Blastocatellia bacterium]